MSIAIAHHTVASMPQTFADVLGPVGGHGGHGGVGGGDGSLRVRIRGVAVGARVGVVVGVMVGHVGVPSWWLHPD